MKGWTRRQFVEKTWLAALVAVVVPLVPGWEPAPVKRSVSRIDELFFDISFRVDR